MILQMLKNNYNTIYNYLQKDSRTDRNLTFMDDKIKWTDTQSEQNDKYVDKRLLYMRIFCYRKN